MITSNYKNKYLKYKIEYYNLLNQLGGDKPIITDFTIINKFTDPEMEEYLNPIYGAAIQYYVDNNYFLAEPNIKDETKIEQEININIIRNKIKKLVQNINNTILPTNNIKNFLKPIDFGRFIAIKYINKKINDLLLEPKSIFNEEVIKYKTTKEFKLKESKDDLEKSKDDLEKELKKSKDELKKKKINKKIKKINKKIEYIIKKIKEIDKSIIEQGFYDSFIHPYITLNKDYTKINKYINLIDIIEEEKIKNKNGKTIKKKNLLTKYFNINNNFDSIYFYLILYCLWWNLDNDDGIVKYYEGIEEIFNMVNFFLNEDYYFKIKTKEEENSNNNFENYIYKLLTPKFKKFSQENSQNFCYKLKYPDCGITTARNFINLLIFDESKNILDINILNKYEPRDELKKYYETYYNFNLQLNKKLNIKFNKENKEEQLTARDAWSCLIINYASTDIRFKEHCKDGHGYEVDSGLNKTKITYNFYQLMMNLFPKLKEEHKSEIKNNQTIKPKWDYFINDKIKSINDQHIDKNGFGNIIITLNNKDNDIYTIQLQKFHYELQVPKTIKSIVKPVLSQKQETLVEKIFDTDSIDIENYLWKNITLEKLSDTFDSSKNNFKIKLFELILTNKYTDDDRKNFVINIEEDGQIINNNKSQFDKKKNVFTYKYLTFDFVETYELEHLNTYVLNYLDTYVLDFSKLKNLNSIGDYFLYESYLTNVDLSSLSNVKSIGSNFLSNCKVEELVLPKLSNIETIDNGFLSYCSKLIYLDLTDLVFVNDIGSEFLYECNELTYLYLPDWFFNVNSISDDFLHGCQSLTELDLSSLSGVELIGHFFLAECFSLTKLDLSGLSNIESIGDYFLDECSSLTKLDLSSLSGIKSIGDYFLNGCYGLTELYLSGLSNIESIGDYFLDNCTQEIHIYCTEKTEKLIKSVNTSSNLKFFR